MGGQSPLQLLTRADVQKDLVLTEEQKAKVAELNKKQTEERQAMMEEMRNGGGAGDPNEMRDKMNKMNDEAKKKAEALLTEVQKKRLAEITLQLSGGRALADPKVQKELGFTEEQKTKIAEIQAAQNTKRQEIMQAMREKMQSGEMSREDMRAEMQKAMGKTNDEDFLKVLTPEQKTKFEAMKGKPFKADDKPKGPGGN